jgi:lipoate-protein ligase A
MQRESCGNGRALLRGQRQATWRFLDTGYADPFFNMAVDEAIAIMGRQGWPPTVRVYGWRPAAISIGYSQRIQEALDLKRCARLGIPLVRRITGGRAVLHNEEVTYSVIATREHLGSGNSVLEVYKQIGQALVSSLKCLGVRACLQRMTPRDGRRRAAQGQTPCFTSSGRYEVMAAGRKVAGSAQRWIGGVVLQHGSLLMGDGHLQIAQLLPRGEAGEEENTARQLRDRTISLGAVLSRRVSYAEVAGALFCGFQGILQFPLVPGQLRPEEEILARRLVQKRYGRREWTLRR